MIPHFEESSHLCVSMCVHIEEHRYADFAKPRIYIGVLAQGKPHCQTTLHSKIVYF